MIFGIFILLNIILDIFGVWYCYNLLKDRVQLIRVFKEFEPIIKGYEQHLKTLSKMELYYGEPTIMALVQHTQEVGEALSNALQSIEVEEDVNDEEE